MNRSKITVFRSLLIGACLTIALISGPESAQAQMAVSFDTQVPLADLIQSPNTITGWSFTANRDLYVTKLGLWDFEKDTTTETNHFVGLWDNTGNLLTSVAFTEAAHKADPSNPFHFYDLATSYKLEAGKTYIVGANMVNDFYIQHDPSDSNTVPIPNLHFSSDISYQSDKNFDLTTLATGQNYYNTSFIFTSLTNGPGGVNDPNTVYSLGANFDAVPTPIPAAAWLLGSGLLGLVGIRRKQQ
jgi:hypothetical protein